MADNESSSSNQHNSVIIKPSNLECKNLYDYLKTRSATTLEKLYNHPTICLAVYRCDALLITFLCSVIITIKQF
jgi:hypothetical protein